MFCIVKMVIHGQQWQMFIFVLKIVNENVSVIQVCLSGVIKILFTASTNRLADLATFHQAISKTYNLTNQNKWISFGGSYPGALSAWFRIKVWRNSCSLKQPLSNYKIKIFWGLFCKIL